jgi:hypothetical protein
MWELDVYAARAAQCQQKAKGQLASNSRTQASLRAAKFWLGARRGCPDAVGMPRPRFWSKAGIPTLSGFRQRIYEIGLDRIALVEAIPAQIRV